MTKNKSFGEILRDSRLEGRFKLKHIAIFAGVSVGYISDIEHGRKRAPTPKLAKKIERSLNISDGRLVESSKRERQIVSMPEMAERIQKLEKMVDELKLIVEKNIANAKNSN